LKTQCVLEQLRQVETRAGGAAGTAFGGVGRFANVFDRLIRRVRAHVHMMFALHRRTDPTVLRPIELNFLASDELIEIKRGKYPSERKSVRVGNTICMVCRDDGAGTGHVWTIKVGLPGIYLVMC